ncbi:MAG: hypothetical protein ACI8ZO_001583 [Flavobacteriales bacterium]|jgi:hypothetical protein
MKKALFTLFILFQISSVFGQRINEIGLETSYGIRLDDRFMKDFYDFKFDLGIQYNFLEKEKFILGVTCNLSKFSNENFDIRLITWVPQLELGYRIALGNFMITPKVAIGYASDNFRMDSDRFNSNGQPISKETYTLRDQGVSSNIGLAIAMPISTNFAVNVQCDYQFMRLKSINNPRGDSWNSTHMLYPRIGVSYTLDKK